MSNLRRIEYLEEAVKQAKKEIKGLGRARERERMALENGATGHIQRNKAATAAEAEAEHDQ